jgi:predicted nucleotidyltransferase
MGIKSKEENVLILFFNESSKQWHFSDIIKTSKISKRQASLWLKKFIDEKLIIRIKKKGKMPYFQANFNHPNYQNKKKLYILNQLYNSGLLSHLQSLKSTNTIILFGSIVRSDWNSSSDIDLFIFGDDSDFNQTKFSRKLNKEISLFSYPSINDLKKADSSLIKNIVNGYVVKGDINDLIGVI